MVGAPHSASVSLGEAVARRRGAGPSPSKVALDEALAFLDEHGASDGAVRLRPADTELLAGHRARGSVVEVAGVDRPLVVDSLAVTLRAEGVGLVDVVAVTVGVDRTGGRIRGLGPARAATHAETLVQIELDRDLDDGAAAAITAALDAVIATLVVVTTDHLAMRRRLQSATIALAGSAGIDPESSRGIDDAVRTVRWLLDDNAVLLALRADAGTDPDGGQHRRDGAGLGGTRASGSGESHPTASDDTRPDLGLWRVTGTLDGIDLGDAAPVGPSRPLQVCRLAAVSPLVRRDPMLRLDLWAPDGSEGGAVETLLWIGSHRAAGSPLASVPVLRRKLDELLARRDIVAGSYDEQHLTLLFQSLPEDDLFGLDSDELDALLGDLLVEDHDARIRVVLRPLPGSHSVAALLTMPVDRWTRQLRRRIERFLSAQLDGHQVDVALAFVTGADAVTARVVVHVDPDRDLPTGLDPVARELRLLCRSWDEDLAAALTAHAEVTRRATPAGSPAPAAEPGAETDPGGGTEPGGETETETVADAAPGAWAGSATELAERWAARLPAAFRDTVSGHEAVADVLALEAVSAGHGDAGAASARVWLSAATRPDEPARMGIVVDGPVDLSTLLPALESLGLWVTEDARWHAGEGLTIHHLGVRAREASAPALAEAADRLRDAVAALVTGEAEVDGLNRLVLHAGLAVADVEVLRAYRRYRHQVTPQHDESYIDDVLVGQPEIARRLVALWHARFASEPVAGAERDGDPARSSVARAQAVADALRAVEEACDALPRLDHDRILRGLAFTVDATLRTNRWINPAGPLALKLDPAQVPDAPHPRPYREIFVTGRTVEGVHLRAGPVSRGGLRASDRAQDYRAEVLDLMRTQVLKNAVIVPTGAKGGFVLRGAGDDGRSRSERVAAAYDDFVGALLDVTDDVEGDRVIPTPGRWDGDDPYLVVAADKGTASFSDRANAIAERRGFWLGDAFASGGSQGYDHKALGITARGAWVAIRAHMRALGLDPDVDEITVAGVGDMSGDVFGNGLLHSDRLRLVAAFDHRHVFLDPDPDPVASFVERRRLFELPRSSWADYRTDVISVGGGVHDRTAKAVPLSEPVRAALRVDAEELTPAELARAVLRAPVDLLYFGGIGTFVRASTEDDSGIDDRANAELRVTATEVRARVVGEGANLAVTQRARVELARRGGRVNADAIDNAAGVDCSDHEVNLKILLAQAIADGALDPADRDGLLAAHAEEVVAAVLADCEAQSDALDRAELDSPEGVDAAEMVLRRLVTDGVLDPEVEALPDERAIAARRAAGAGFTRPEMAVLLAGVKRRVSGGILASEVPDEPAMRDALHDYFPSDLAVRFDASLDRHRLRRELVASEVANDLVDHLGITATAALGAELDVDAATIAAAYWVARAVVRAPRRWADLRDGRTRVDPAVAADPLDGGEVLARLLRSLTRSELLRRRAEERAGRRWDPQLRIDQDRPVADALLGHLAAEPASRSEERRRFAERLAGGLRPEVAEATALLPELDVVPDVALVARDLDVDPLRVAGAFRAFDHRLGLADLRRRIERTAAAGPWASSARQGLLDDLVGIRREAARRALAADPAAPPDDAVSRHLAIAGAAIDEASRVRRRLAGDDAAGLDALAVAVRCVRRAAL